VTKENLETTLARILGLSDHETALPPRYAAARAWFVEAHRGQVSSTLSIARIAAYARGKLDTEDRRAFEGDIASSDDALDEVTSALHFLAQVDAGGETAPDALFGTVIASIRGTAGLAAYLADGQPLTMDHQRMLFSDPVLRAEFRRLKQEFATRAPSGATVEMRALAAAASDLEGERRVFSGGSVTSKRLAGQEIVVLIRFDEPGISPRALLLEGVDGEMWREPLDVPDADGEIVFYKDPSISDHATFLRLLCNPTTIGTFLQQSGSGRS
jgi:hypothetical protein